MNRKALDLKRKLGALKSRSEKPVKKEKLTFTLSPEWKRESEFVYTRTIIEDNPLDFKSLPAYDFFQGFTDMEECLFFDVESTGLSGGAGNVIFLYGLGQIKGDKMEIRQFFLSDFPGEAEYVALLKEALPPNKLYVSYNGKSFDAHVTASRFSLHGESISFPNHYDLLYMTRRFWREVIGSCSLGDMEEKVLGVERVGDVPGFMVPGIYFDFLKTAKITELEKVFYHNHIDILSLGTLLNHMLHVLGGRYEGCDLHGIGKFLLDYDMPRGEDVLRRSFFHEGSRKSGEVLSLHLKRRGLWEEACRIWETMFSRTRSVFPAIELAKYYEHRQKNLALALEWVNRVLKMPFPLIKEHREEVVRRKARLVEKLERLG